jgi:Ca-activated chloride channel family protein
VTDVTLARRPNRTAAAIGTALLLLSVSAPAQSPRPRTPTFGTGIEVIRLNLAVTDGRNRLVTGLSEDDFAVFEDGVRQELSFFTREALPLSVTLLLDCSASMQEKLPAAQEAAWRFLKTLGPEDRAQVAQFNDRITLLEDFTADHQALEAAIRATRASGTTVLYNAVYVSLKQLGRQGSPDAPRRRAIVLLTDGEDTASVIGDDQVLELARQTDVGVYSISLRSDRPQDRDRIAFGQATHFLTALARDSGGEVYFPGALSELDGVYGRVAEELRSQYTLGYISRNSRRDGKWRQIVVRTPTHDDLQVRHKVGYYASKG